MQYDTDTTDYATFISYPPDVRDQIIQLHTDATDIEWANALFIKSANAYVKQQRQLAQVYKYMVTFTTRPDAREGSLEFLESQAYRECLGITYFEYAIEHPDSNLHYHVMIHTTKPLLKSSFKWWIQNRGTVKIDKVTKGTDGNTLCYLKKELKSKILVP